MDQPKIERLLRLMMLLTSNHSYTISDLAEKFDMSERTIYRYIDTFQQAGFLIKKRENIVKIDKKSPYFREISELVHFTEEEAYILKKAIESIDENNLIKQNLKKKLYAAYDYKLIADVVVHAKNRDNIHLIIQAIEEKKQLKLYGYHSANSNTVTDRIIEPFSFTTNYIQIWGYEPASGENKSFKVSRITKVELLNSSWQYQEKHHAALLDVFRISSQKKIPICLLLSVRAANLLIEEYPLSEQYLSQISENKWQFKTEISSFEGIGRFILGLYDEIEIIENEQLKRYINNKILKMRKMGLSQKKECRK